MKIGFTLVELMIVIAVTAILATMALFGLGRAQAAARNVQRNQIINAVRAALERYYADVKSYPTGAGGGWYSAAATTTLFNGAVTGALDTYLSGNLTDPGCGAAGVTVKQAQPMPSPCGAVTYAYTTTVTTCTGAPYQITLAKEGGGTATFCGPQ
jgi:prepilin-type N-terminal cleavage/methylation domain-containing protein